MRKKTKNKSSGGFIAFTDSNTSAQGEITAAIIIMDVKETYIHSAHNYNFGAAGFTSTKAEIIAQIAALHHAPAGELLKVYCDNIGAGSNLQKFKHRGSANQIRDLSEEEYNNLVAGLQRQPAVEFLSLPRSHHHISLADKFSRLALGRSEGVKSAIPDRTARLYDQKEEIRIELS